MDPDRIGPYEIREKLGLGPGSVLEWNEQGDQVIVRRAGRYASADIHAALFSDPEPGRHAPDSKAGIRKYIRRRHARD